MNDNLENTDNQQIPLWSPSDDLINNSNMMMFINYLNDNHNKNFSSYYELYDWSVNDMENFWNILLEFSEIIFSGSIDSIHNNPHEQGFGPGVKWFGGVQFNFANNLLRYADDHTAIVSWNENGKQQTITYKELYKKVAACAEGLKILGITKGDNVAGFVSNIPEAIIAMLAATSLGAVWSSTSPDFGVSGVVERFGQIKPKILFAVGGYKYNGKYFDTLSTLEKISENIPDLKKIILIPFDNEKQNGDYLLWDDLLSNKIEEIDFRQVSFDHPVFTMFSSGTTGVPKCIVHGGGGTLLQHFKELSLHTNLKRDDKIFYFTTCGWMMWNWMVSSLYIGATVFLYDGSPFYPNQKALWKILKDEQITVFGTSPKFLTASQKLKVKPSADFELSSLKTVLSTGAPLSKDNFEWVYTKVKNDVQLSSISGGTDIISCFMLGNPILPVYSEEIQCRGLGMKVEAYDSDGQATENQKGELVCTAPFPSMPVYFGNDTEGKRYHSAYFNNYPGVWRHGDYIRITEHGGIVVYGRSDSTLNPGGVRIGTSEIYRIVESLDEVADSIVVGQKWKDDTRILLFVVLKNEIKLDDALILKIKKEIKNSLTARHVPEKVFQISEVPVTMNGKKVEMAVTNILNNETVENKSALANPESLGQFIKFI